VGNQFLFVNLS